MEKLPEFNNIRPFKIKNSKALNTSKLTNKIEHLDKPLSSGEEKELLENVTFQITNLNNTLQSDPDYITLKNSEEKLKILLERAVNLRTKIPQHYIQLSDIYNLNNNSEAAYDALYLGYKRGCKTPELIYNLSNFAFIPASIIASFKTRIFNEENDLKKTRAYYENSMRKGLMKEILISNPNYLPAKQRVYELSLENGLYDIALEELKSIMDLEFRNPKNSLESLLGRPLPNDKSKIEKMLATQSTKRYIEKANIIISTLKDSNDDDKRQKLKSALDSLKIAKLKNLIAKNKGFQSKIIDLESKLNLELTFFKN